MKGPPATARPWACVAATLWAIAALTAANARDAGAQDLEIADATPAAVEADLEVAASEYPERIVDYRSRIVVAPGSLPLVTHRRKQRSGTSKQ